jgi:hypothetical protein
MLQGPHYRRANRNEASTNCPGGLDRPRRGFRYAIRLVERKTCVQFRVSRGGDSRNVRNRGKVNTAATNRVYRAPVQDEACRRWLKRNR